MKMHKSLRMSLFVAAMVRRFRSLGLSTFTPRRTQGSSR